MKIMERTRSAGMRPRLTDLGRTEPGYQAYSILYIGYIALPIVAGLDKFGHFLVDWTRYLAPVVPGATGLQPDAFMMLAGVVEIAAGFLVAVKPRWGSAVVAAWLMGIIVNLLLLPGFYDVALRDFGLALGALALWRLAGQYGERRL